MNKDGHYLDGVEGTLPLPGTTKRGKSTFSVNSDPHWNEDCPTMPMNDDETNSHTFTITRVVEFDGVQAFDRGLTVEFYGALGHIRTLAMDTACAAALRVALVKAGV